MTIPPILEVGGILLSSDIFTENFCCDLEACKGACCIEGDAGAPVSLDEMAGIEDSLDSVWSDLSAQGQSVIDRQGIAYTDEEGDLVTSIVNGRDCVFTCYDKGGCCLCALERAYRNGTAKFCKPISCALYPIRVKEFADGTIALNYHRWNICQKAVEKGKQIHLPLYRFLEGPLTRRFGEKWYGELCNVADELQRQGAF
jgi:hypothetical protein